MNEDQLYDAAEREMDIYRSQLAKAHAEANEAKAATRAMRDIVCKLLDLYGPPDARLMQHSSVTRSTLLRYATEAGVRPDGLEAK